MAKFKVVLEFHYDSEENIDEWNIEVGHSYVTTKEEAIDTAIAEVEANSISDFEFDVTKTE